MVDLTALKEKRKAYVKAEAERIAQYMVDKNLTTDKMATCDAPNWTKNSTMPCPKSWQNSATWESKQPQASIGV